MSQPRRPEPGSYSIVSTMREAPEIVAAFVAHHLTMKADEVFVFLDAPNPEVSEMLADLPRCRVTVCDDAYWLAIGHKRRPRNIVRRQLRNAEQARKLSQSEWLIHIDSDEFLHETGDLVAELASVPDTCSLVKINNIERCWPKGVQPSHIFDGIFRDQIIDKSDLMLEVYGQSAQFLHNGFAGYVVGKTAIRVDSTRPMKLHVQKRETRRGDLPFLCTSTTLLHFDGFTPLHWISKFLRRLEANQLGGSRKRQKQLDFIAKAATDEERLALFEKIMVLDAPTQTKLAELGALKSLNFDPSPAIKAVFPGRTFDLSVENVEQHYVSARPEWFTASAGQT
jgi:Glycosyl transferase family 2